MVDRTELRKLAEAASGWPWEHKHNAELIAIGDGMYLQIGKINDIEAAIHDGKLIAAASPDVVLGLLDEVDELTKQFDHAMAMSKRLMIERDQLRAEVERQKAWARQMALSDAVVLREVLGIIAEFDPAVTHGWAECVREMARSALRVNGESR